MRRVRHCAHPTDDSQLGGSELLEWISANALNGSWFIRFALGDILEESDIGALLLEALSYLHSRRQQAVCRGLVLGPKGNHPGLVLARRLQRKAEQVWLFATNPKVPWTNNASEQALKSPKPHQKVSGYWHTTFTLARFCRVRSYLVSARNHGISAIDAIHAALTGKPWLPIPATT